MDNRQPSVTDRQERERRFRRICQRVPSNTRLTSLNPVGSQNDIEKGVLVDRKSKMGLKNNTNSRKNDEAASKLATGTVKILWEIVEMNEPDAGQRQSHR